MQQHNQSSDVKISREIDMQSTYVYFYQQQCRFFFLLPCKFFPNGTRKEHFKFIVQQVDQAGVDRLPLSV